MQVEGIDTIAYLSVYIDHQYLEVAPPASSIIVSYNLAKVWEMRANISVYLDYEGVEAIPASSMIASAVLLLLRI